MNSEVFRSGLAAAGAVKARHRLATAGGERLAEDVLRAAG
jgi:hypothetical protein